MMFTPNHNSYVNNTYCISHTYDIRSRGHHCSSCNIINKNKCHSNSHGPDVIDSLTAGFRKGEISLISGPNGIGKTTLINITLGILQNLKSGTVEYNGVNTDDVDLYSARRDGISVLIQRTDLPDSTVEGYLEDALGLERNGIASMIRLMGMEDSFLGKDFDVSKYRDTKINTMSGGEKQKIMLIKVLGRRKDVMILDEPSTGMDDAGIEGLLDYIVSVRKDRITVIISHDRRFVRIADNIIELS